MTQNKAFKAKEFGMITELVRHVHREKAKVIELRWRENIAFCIEIGKQCDNAQRIKILVGTYGRSDDVVPTYKQYISEYLLVF